MDNREKLHNVFFILNPYSANEDTLHAQASREALETYAAYINDRGEYEKVATLLAWRDECEKQIAKDAQTDMSNWPKFNGILTDPSTCYRREGRWARDEFEHGERNIVFADATYS